ncbi:MAG: hypothetical protein WBP29_01090 [Candidatus Zixiibacteriota bacterium]
MRLAAILIFTAALFFPLANPISAESNKPPLQTTAFVDRDGDGFNDATPDQNADGIPDDLNFQASATSDSTVATQFSFAPSMMTVNRLPVFLRNSTAFDYLKSQLVGLSQHRGAFSAGAEFGPGADIGSGAVLGGGCIGGVCTPK